MPNPHRPRELIRLTVPRGTREAYQEVARLAGMPLQTWYREALRKVAREVLEEHGVKRRLPAVHLPKPKRLQPRIKIPPRADDEPEG